MHGILRAASSADPAGRLSAAAGPPSGGPIRVAFVLNSFDIGGTELNAIRTAEVLDPARVALRVIAFHGEGQLRARYDALGVPVEVVSIRNLYGLETMRRMRGVAAGLRAQRVEIVHTHDVYCNIFGVPVGRLAGARGVIASRRWWKRTPRSGLLAANRVAYALAHRVLANSASVGQMLRSEEWVPERKIVVIPNFLEPGAFEVLPVEARRTWRAQLGLPLDVPLAGMVARLAPVKDHRTFLRALAALPADCPLRGVLVGDGPERARLEQLTRELGLEGRVHFLGEMPSRPTTHQLFDVAVLTSLSEGFPNSLLEAMAVGTPVVATRVGGVADTVVDGDTGVLLPPGDVDALAAVLARLVADGAERRRLGERGRARAQAGFTTAAMLERLYVLYEGLARGGD